MFRYRNWAVLLAVLFIATSGIVDADDTESHSNQVVASSSDVTIWDDLRWLAGRWEGEAFGGRCEEVWSEPSGGSMAGMFKLVVNSKVAFYELMTITIDSCGPVLFLKHFNADMTGWEEKDEVINFACDGYAADEIRFAGLSYWKVSDDSLRIVLSTQAEDGTISENVIDCRRAD
jgi:hypothetical protein